MACKQVWHEGDCREISKEVIEEEQVSILIGNCIYRDFKNHGTSKSLYSDFGTALPSIHKVISNSVTVFRSM